MPANVSNEFLAGIDAGRPLRQHAPTCKTVTMCGCSRPMPLLAQEALEIVPIQVGAQYLTVTARSSEGWTQVTTPKAAPDLSDIVVIQPRAVPREYTWDQVPPRRVRINVGHDGHFTLGRRVTSFIAGDPNIYRQAVGVAARYPLRKLRSQTNGGKRPALLTYEQFRSYKLIALMGPSDL